MSFLSPPEMPAPPMVPPPPPPPRRADASIQDGGFAARQAAAAAAGRGNSGTVSATKQGVAAPATTSKQLFGE